MFFERVMGSDDSLWIEMKNSGWTRVEMIRVSIGLAIVIPLLIIFGTKSLGFRGFREVLADYYILFGLLITLLLSKGGIRRGNIFRMISNLFTELDFREFSTIKLSSLVYFCANLVFWSINTKNLLLVESSPFLQVLLISLGGMLGLRLTLESLVALIRIAEKPS